MLLILGYYCFAFPFHPQTPLYSQQNDLIISCYSISRHPTGRLPQRNLRNTSDNHPTIPLQNRPHPHHHWQFRHQRKPRPDHHERLPRARRPTLRTKHQWQHSARHLSSPRKSQPKEPHLDSAGASLPPDHRIRRRHPSLGVWKPRPEFHILSVRAGPIGYGRCICVCPASELYGVGLGVSGVCWAVLAVGWGRRSLLVA